MINDRESVRYSVSGLVKCPHCGVTMQPMLRAKKVRRPSINGRPNPFDVTWRCRTQSDMGTCRESGYGNLEHIETHVINWLDRHIPDPPIDLQDRIERASAHQATVVQERSAEDEIADLERQEDNLAKAVSVGAISLDAARRRQEKILSERQEIQERQPPRTTLIEPGQEDRPRAEYMGIVAEWGMASPDQRNKILRTVIGGIQVYKGRGIPLDEKYRIVPKWAA
ncbi:zinc ribbon domain-containing protein [Kitasatospora phosalacinea]|uniref:zinc ribbon domain-containing protein n=1 Tax=Kitasatospora phosalacinea TaxID=2065 RepID=UPI0022771C9A|nr:zinc ribbon domain-containing protein [Kitasatospora phosalacinea]